MYSAAFMFSVGTLDDEFHRLNGLIDAAADETNGFIGSESWVSASGDVRNATYYWETLEALQTFSRHPKHLEAKKQYQRWYDGYHIVVSEIIRSYGDDGIEHFTPNDRASSA
jgi:heme-degrading monooxygenase HmoA